MPEVIQSSGMDCGPAALKALLEGHGLSASYGRLREACQTEVDGTSISTLDDVARSLGLHTEEQMLPVDHVLLPEAGALPALAVVAQPGGLTHFVVVWSRVGPLVQVMDPGVGRVWMRQADLEGQLYRHVFPVPSEAWREWAGGPEFCGALGRRLRDLGIRDGETLLQAVLADPHWLPLARLDAAVRLATTVCRGGSISRGAGAGALVQALASGDWQAIPARFWSVRPTSPGRTDSPQLSLVGAVLLRVQGRGEPQRQRLSEELAAALDEPEPRPLRTLLGLAREDGSLAPLTLAATTVVAGAVVTLEAVLLRGLLDLGWLLGLVGQRVAAAAGLLFFLLAAVAIEWPGVQAGLSSGRALELRLRQAFLQALPRLGDRYFQSRLVSDMAERAHSMHVLRDLPELGRRLLLTTVQLLLTVLGIAWLDPAAAPLAALVALLGVVLPLVFHPLLSERDLRVRSHLGAISRFYLDALLGLTAVRAHAAERTVRAEHEALVVAWGRASLSLHRAATLVEGLLALAGALLAAALVGRHVAAAGQVDLLLVYWALALPALGAQVAVVSRQYPALRSVTLRLLEPMAHLDEPAEAPLPAPAPASRGVAVQLTGVGVVAGGHPLLHELTLTLRAGERVGVVGPSGAGKSTLLSLLLGWHRPATGQLRVDGAPLDAPALDRLRQQTAWVDPEVSLWNRSLLQNLRYGAGDSDRLPTGELLDQAELFEVLDRLPDGLQSTLGEGGGMISGGEGQRVRLARAMGRRDARLVLLDEPFRGLDRHRRSQLLCRALRWWQGATVLCATHDVGETRSLDRVLVVQGGTIVEDGAPDELLSRPGSRYRALLRAEEALRRNLWSGPGWRHLWVESGRISEGEQLAEAAR